MTPALVVGASFEAPEAEVEVAEQSGSNIALRYVQPNVPGSRYPVPLPGRRFEATVRLADNGWIAQATELDSLGYGASIEAAIENLCEEIAEYLAFLRDERPLLAAETAHHAVYIDLLDVPRAVWFASITVDATPLE
jgi:hypothetical protein